MKAERPEQSITDEQRVVIFLAMRMTNPGLPPGMAQSFTYAEIERDCTAFWSAAGVVRYPGTWRRAAQRAMGVQAPGQGFLKRGMLGATTGKRVPGGVHSRFTFDRDFESLLRAAGTDYQTIAHGNRAR